MLHLNITSDLFDFVRSRALESCLPPGCIISRLSGSTSFSLSKDPQEQLLLLDIKIHHLKLAVISEVVGPVDILAGARFREGGGATEIFMVPAFWTFMPIDSQ